MQSLILDLKSLDLVFGILFYSSGSHGDSFAPGTSKYGDISRFVLTSEWLEEGLASEAQAKEELQMSQVAQPPDGSICGQKYGNSQTGLRNSCFM